MSIAALREDNPLGFKQSLEPGGSEKKNGKDAEVIGDPFRKYSRIGPAVNGAARADSDSDSDSGDVGRQMEREADAAIKYRTCSWQKVGRPFSPLRIAFE
jgi:hypothetical protein